MRIAFLNIQNLFFRHRYLQEGRSSLNIQRLIEEMDRLVRMMGKGSRELNRIQELTFLLNFDQADHQRYASLRSRGSKLHLRNMNYPELEKACNTNQWNGWVELLNHPLNPVSIQNKARLVSSVQADVLLLQEVEDWDSIKDFNRKILPEYPGSNYDTITMAPSFSGLGLEHALMLKADNKTKCIYTYSEERTSDGKVLFNRGCFVFVINSSSNGKMAVISTQFLNASQDKSNPDEFRLKQTHRIIEIYHELKANGIKDVMVMGTLNAYSYAYSISPLFSETGLKDICRHPNFRPKADTENPEYFRLGGYGRGINIRQVDYFLVSRGLFERIKCSGISREGMWPGTNPKWQVFRSIKKQENQASEHPILWVEL